MKHLVKKSISLVVAICLMACSDSRSPTVSNYEQVIKKTIESDDNFPHCFFRYNFPIQMNGFQLKMSGSKRELELLVKLGLVDYESAGTGDKWNMAKSSHRFSLTDEGQKYYIADRGLCMGRVKFKGVKDVSEPYKERGKTYVRGVYSWTIELPEWAMKPEFHSSELFSGELYYFKYKKLLKNESREEHFVLTQKDHGWDF